MKELQETAAMMCSADYKERFKAEYYPVADAHGETRQDGQGLGQRRVEVPTDLPAFYLRPPTACYARLHGSVGTACKGRGH